MCGIVGIVSKEGKVIEDAITLLNALNNRGEQACGAAVFDGKDINFYRDEGLVSEVFGPKNKRMIQRLHGSACTAQALYSTIGRGGKEKQPKMFQPLGGKHRGVSFYVSHNGNLVNIGRLRGQAKKAGYKFNSKLSDTEVIVALISTSKQENFIDAVLDMLKKIKGKGAFSLVILYKNKIIAIRDHNGIRPLCIGKKNGDIDSYIVASENSVFPALRSARFIREVFPGEMIVLGPNGIEKSIMWASDAKPKLCIAELIYFANPATTFSGVSVYSFRVETGKRCALEHPVTADVIVPVPDSGRGAADGVAHIANKPKLEGIVKSRYALRTFMQPREVDRSRKQRAKLQVIPDVMQGQSVCLVEDSLFRGSVARPAVSLSRVHGKAREVHLMICSPPVRHRCHLGLDTSTQKELIASHMTVDEIRDNFVLADSLNYLSLEGLKKSLEEKGLSPDDFCFGCFTGEYPVSPPYKK